MTELNDYEGIFIAKPSLSEELIKKLLSQIEAEISKNGGKIENVENWGRKNLAYSVKKNKEGVYFKLDFKIDPAKILELKNFYRLNEDILRSSIIKK